jgi:ABC-type antimicrobial peptide transport system permease subunit
MFLRLLSHGLWALGQGIALELSRELMISCTVLISSFAIAAVLLSVLGIYGVIAFSVALREQEMAVRIALGCQRSGWSCSS